MLVSFQPPHSGRRSNLPVQCISLGEAFDLYRQDVILYENKSAKKEEMHEIARKSLLLFLGGDIPLNELTFEHIRRWRTDMERRGRAIGTIYGYIVQVRCVLAYAQKKNFDCVDYNEIRTPKRKRKRAPAFLTEDEVTELIAALEDNREYMLRLRNPAMGALIYSSGIRVSELVGLNISDVRYDTFTVGGKGGDPRPCFIDERARFYIDRYLKARRDNSPALFVSEQTKTRISVGTVQEVFRNARQKTGITAVKITPHIGRHSFATNFLRNNGNMRYLQRMLGHESLETTQIYASVVDEDLRDIHRRFHSIEQPKLHSNPRPDTIGIYEQNIYN